MTGCHSCQPSIIDLLHNFHEDQLNSRRFPVFPEVVYTIHYTDAAAASSDHSDDRRRLLVENVLFSEFPATRSVQRNLNTAQSRRFTGRLADLLPQHALRSTLANARPFIKLHVVVCHTFA